MSAIFAPPPCKPACPSSPDGFCLDCKLCTHCLGEYYNVHDSVWDAVGKPAGMLCIGCLEARLGRQLTVNDFSIAPINNPFHPICGRWPRSALFMKRLGHANQPKELSS